MCSITLKQHEQYSTWRKSLMGSCIYVYIRVQGCQWKSQKNVELHFVVSLCVRCTHAKPEGANTEAPKGLKERHIISLDIDESRKFLFFRLYFGAKNAISTEDWYPWIWNMIHLHYDCSFSILMHCGTRELRKLLLVLVARQLPVVSSKNFGASYNYRNNFTTSTTGPDSGPSFWNTPVSIG